MKNFLIGFIPCVAPGLLIYLLGVRDFKSWSWLIDKKK